MKKISILIASVLIAFLSACANSPENTVANAAAEKVAVAAVNGQPWQAGVTYQTGNTVTYNGATYECVQGHTALTGWEPSNVPALWKYLGTAVSSAASSVAVSSSVKSSVISSVVSSVVVSSASSAVSSVAVSSAVSSSEPIGPATGVPGSPSISHNNWDGSATFPVTMNMWWGNNGTRWELYLDGSLIKTVSLVDNSPNPQSAVTTITVGNNGSHSITSRLINRFGATAGNTVNVTVTKAGNVSSSSVSSVVSSSSSSQIVSSSSSSVIVVSSSSKSSAVSSQASSAYSSANTTLPKRVMSGYWHTWSGGAGFIPLSKVDSSWDVINISFAEPVTPGSTDGRMKFAVSTENGYSDAQFKADIKALQAKGKKIVLAIGGYEGYFSLTSQAGVDRFVSDINAMINTYGFDGIDIDLEQSSLQHNSGADPDFKNPVSPKIVYFIKALRAIMDARPASFLLTYAPETMYMQQGYQYYGGINPYVDSRCGSYLPVIYALRDRLSWVQVQLYNSGAILGLDGSYYTMGDEKSVVGMCSMLLTGFNVNQTGAFYPALRPDQVVIGVPASAGAAGSGQLPNASLQNAFRTLEAKYPGMRGIMAWSVNWDNFANGNSFAQQNRAFLNTLP